VQPKSRLRAKLTSYFGALLAVATAVSGVLVYARVAAIVTETIDANLDSSSDLIKRIVQVSIENNRGQVKKDLIVADHFLGTDVRVFDERRLSIPYVDTITEQRGTVEVPLLKIAGVPVTMDNAMTDRIAAETGGIVSIYQVCDLGLVSVATNLSERDGSRRVGQLIPHGAPLDILVRRTGTWFGRDYFDGEWYYTALKLLTSGGRIVGALYVALEQTDLDSLREDILSIKVGGKGSAYIVDTLSTAVVHESLEGESLYNHAYIQDLIFKKDGRIRYVERDKTTGKRTDYVAYFKFVPEMNWIVVVGSSMEDFFGGLYAIRWTLIIVFLATMVATLATSVLIGRTISRPIVVIARKFQEIAEGEADLSKRLYVQSNDEVEELAINFNRFLDKLKALKELEKREIEMNLTDAQMTALQAQINPHFLYNTLETIRFMIALGDERAVTMVQLLADLFRVSIGKGERYVTLQQELHHVRLYVSIQELRYPDRFTVSYDLDDAALRLFTVKFLLQPIIENSIHHGFETIESGGAIHIRARVEEDILSIVIEDNGAGILPDRLARLQAQLRGEEPAKSIGLLNVHERLRLHFGETFGISISSEEGRGTVTTLTLPVLRAEPSSSWVRTEAERLVV
jgi:sensor histidine kinase YesM